MRKKLLLFAITLLSMLTWGRAETTVDWFNNGSTLLLDQNGVALSQGVATTNTDGMLVQLGYFTAATAANNFAGTWVPLTGAGPTHTSIGDSDNLGGNGNGVIAFNTFFAAGTANVDVYTGDPGHYVTQSQFSITNTLPASGQILSIRFYDTTTGTSGHYNTVSADNWLWQTPDTAGGGTVAINLATSALSWESFDVYGISHALGDFRTVILIPEPSTVALLGMSAAGWLLIRRRAKKA